MSISEAEPRSSQAAVTATSVACKAPPSTTQKPAARLGSPGGPGSTSATPTTIARTTSTAVTTPMHTARVRHVVASRRRTAGSSSRVSTSAASCAKASAKTVSHFDGYRNPAYPGAITVSSQ